MKFRAITFLILLLSSGAFYAQNVSITNDASDPDPSAMLDIKSTQSGLLIPRMTSAEKTAIAMPANGLLVFDTTTNSFWFHNGAWTEIKEGDDAQTLSLAGHSLQISNGNTVLIPDNQTLSITGNDVSISNGNTITLPTSQTLSLTGSDLSISDGNTITLPDSDNQTLNVAGGNISISGGNTVALPANQTLSLVGNDLTISDGNMVTLPVSTILSDTDGDTRIEVEETPDEDVVRIHVGPWSSPAWQFVDKRLESLYGYEVKIGFETGLDMGETPYARNTLVGYKAGRDITPQIGGNGMFNSCFGNLAGTSTTTGKRNALIGSSAGSDIQTGSNNTMLGTNAGVGIVSGNDNTIIGASAGSLVQGSGNIFIGYEAGYYADGDNRLFIDNSNTSSPLLYGEFANDLLRINGTLEIGNEYSFPTIDGNNGQVLTTDGTGNTSWAAPGTSADNQTLSLSGSTLSISNGNSVNLPASSSDKIEDADGDTRIAVEQNPDEDIVKIFLANGLDPKFQFNENRLEYPAGNSLRIGTNAGALQTSDGPLNTFIGNLAGASNVSGNYNTFVGYQSGEDATGPSNTFVGTQSGMNVTGGSGNTIMGDYAGHSITSGTNNTFIGTGSGGSSTGSENVFIGNQSGTSSSGSNKLYIENSNSNTPLIYGEFDNDYLQVNGELNVGGVFSFPSIDGVSGQVLSTDGAGNVGWVSASGVAQTLSISGNDLSISGGNTIALPASGAFTTASNITSNSNGDSANDDFVFGSPQLDDNGSASNDFRMYFDKSKGAFRAGAVGADQWDEPNVGNYSLAIGRNTKATGYSSTALGDEAHALNNNAVSIGFNTKVESHYGIAFGKYNIGSNTGNAFDPWKPSDPLFEIGVGTSDANRMNAFTILKSGKVIIGQVTDLSIPIGDGYDLVVDGKMLCEEIKVQDSGSWPDFVFEEDYDLMELEEVAKFIDENKHLPGVPSAEEVNGNGFELGEMNEILLKKIEELTLYILELQQEVNTLKTK